MAKLSADEHPSVESRFTKVSGKRVCPVARFVNGVNYSIRLFTLIPVAIPSGSASTSVPPVSVSSSRNS